MLTVNSLISSRGMLNYMRSINSINHPQNSSMLQFQPVGFTCGLLWHVSVPWFPRPSDVRPNFFLFAHVCIGKEYGRIWTSQQTPMKSNGLLDDWSLIRKIISPDLSCLSWLIMVYHEFITIYWLISPLISHSFASQRVYSTPNDPFFFRPSP